MGNKFFGKSRKALFTLACTALLTVLTGASAYAADSDVVLGGTASLTTTPDAGTDSINYSGTSTVAVTDVIGGPGVNIRLGYNSGAAAALTTTGGLLTINIGANDFSGALSTTAAATIDISSGINLITNGGDLAGIDLSNGTVTPGLLNVDLAGDSALTVGLNAGACQLDLTAGGTATITGNIVTTNTATTDTITLEGTAAGGIDVITGNIDLGDGANTIVFNATNKADIAGNVTGGSGVDTLTFTNDGEITGAVDLELGDNVITVVTGKTGTFGSTLAVTATASGAATTTVSGAGGLDVNGVTTITGTADNAGTLSVDTDGTNDLAGVTFVGAAASKAVLDAKESLTISGATTVANVDAGNYGTIAVTSGKTVTSTGAINITDSNDGSAGSTLTISGDGVFQQTAGTTTLTGMDADDAATLQIATTGTGNKVNALVFAGVTGVASSAILDADQDVTIASVATTHLSGTIDVASGKTATVSGTTAITGDGTSAGTVVVQGAGSAALGATTLTGATNAGTLQIDSTGTNTIGALTLAGTAATPALAMLDANESVTIASVSATHLSGTIDIASGKTATVSGTTAVTGDGTAVSTVVVQGGGSAALGATTITGATNAGTLQIASTGTNTIGAVTLAGAAADMAIVDLNESATLASVTVSTTKDGTIDVLTDKTLTVTGTTTLATDDANLKLTGDGAKTLGAVSITNAGTASAITVSGSGDFTTGAITLVGSGAASEVQIDSSGINSIGAVTFEGAAAADAILDINESVTVASLEATAAKDGSIDVADNKKMEVSGDFTLNNDSQFTLTNNNSTTPTSITKVSGTTSINSTGTSSTLTLAGAGATTLETVNITGDGAAATLDNNMSGTFNATTVTLSGTAADEAVLDLGAGTSNITTMNVASGKNGTYINRGGTNNITTTNVAGILKVTTTAWALSAGETINVAATGQLNNAVGINTTNGKINLDLGAGTTGTVASGDAFARVTGAAAIVTTETTATQIDNVYAANGVNGVTYDVFTTALSTGVNGDTLNTTDETRIYTIANNNAAAANLGVIVSTNTSGINSTITGNGGSTETADALVKIVNNQVNMNAEDNAYVAALTQLTGAELTRGTQQTIGQEATTGTAQAAIQGVLGSAGAVSNQMASFRSGGLSAGMTSFGSGGATAALNDMADAETLADAYESASGEGYTAAAEGTYKKVQVWANGYGGFGEQGTDGEMIGYDFWNIGTMVGLDYAFARELRVGALFGYSYNDATMNWGAGDSQDNALRYGAYASYNWNNFFVDLSPTMGIHLIDSKRNIWNGSVAKSDRTAIDFNISGTVGYTFNLPAEIMITPSYTLGYTMFYDPDYTETGAGAANVSYDSFTSNSLVQDLGVKAGKLFCVSDSLSFLPEAWGGWEVEYLNTGGDRNTTNVGQNFQTTMNGMATHRAYWGLGMTALVNDNISVYGRYDHKIWDKGFNVGFTAGVKVGF